MFSGVLQYSCVIAGTNLASALPTAVNVRAVADILDHLLHTPERRSPIVLHRDMVRRFPWACRFFRCRISSVAHSARVKVLLPHRFPWASDGFLETSLHTYVVDLLFPGLACESTAMITTVSLTSVAYRQKSYEFLSLVFSA